MNDSFLNTTGRARQPVVMIVDDEEMVTRSLASFLQWETEYRVLTALSPVEALRTIRETLIDLVIADFLMPEMNGLQFLAEVKALYPDVPRVLLTGYADKEHAIQAINEVGLFHFIEKPWDNDRLKLVIRNGIESKSLKEVLYEKIRELDQALLQRDALIQQQQVLQEELSLARQVQQGMLPQRLPKADRIVFAARYHPALEIGGDFYDVLPLADDQLAILIADMTGHGIQAALNTALLKMAFAPFAHRAVSPGDILSGINTVLCKGLPQGLSRSLFAAALVVTIDTKTACCRLANGGIPHPFLIQRKDRQVERIIANGMLLGIVSEQLYQPGEEITVQLKEGDSLILYTDGLSEIENEAGELFESGFLWQTVVQHCEQPGAEVLERLLAAARSFSKHGHDWDDITLIGLECNPR